MNTNVSWNKALEPPGYRAPNSDLLQGQGINKRPGWTSCIGQKVMVCERAAVPRKRKFGVSFSPMALVFFFFSRVPQTFRPQGSLTGSSVSFCLYPFCPCFASIPLSSVSPPLLPSPLISTRYLSFLTFSVFCSSFTATYGFNTELSTPAPVPLWYSHDLPSIPLLSPFFSFSFSQNHRITEC